MPAHAVESVRNINLEDMPFWVSFQQTLKFSTYLLGGSRDPDTKLERC